MDLGVAARKLVGELVKGEQLEVRREQIVARDMAKLVEQLGRTPTGRELEDFLGDHAQVENCYAAESLLDDLAHRHFAAEAPKPAISAEDARHPDLERAIVEATDRTEACRIYADWLQERGDPLGELIALGIATDAGVEGAQVRFDRHWKQYEDRFLGGVKLRGLFELQFRNGLVHAIDETTEVASPQWRELLQLRICMAVESISCCNYVSMHDEVIGAFAPPSLRTLSITRMWNHCLDRAQRRVRTLAIRSASLNARTSTFPPNLERLELGWHCLQPTGDFAELGVRELQLELAEFQANILKSVRMPDLERLDLDLQQPDADAIAFLDELDAPNLVALGLHHTGLDAKMFRKLAKLPLAKRLTTLSLTNLDITDELIAELARVKGFAALETIDVSFNELSRAGITAAAALAPKVISTRQLRPGSGNERRIRRWAGSRLAVAEDIAEPRWWKRSGLDGELRWARYKGEAEYELYVSTDLERYGCSCPSSYQPCKHVVALALLAERTPLEQAPSGGIESRVGAQPDE